MKQYFLSLAFLISLHRIDAQITVTKNDFAAAGEKVRMSVAVTDRSLDISTTGPNSVWDYSMLQQDNQKVDTFLYTYQTGITYSFVFSSFSPFYRANLAIKAPDYSPALLLSFTDVFNFYYRGDSSYYQSGFGGTTGGFPKAVGFSHKDTLYRFPVEYGNMDSSKSEWRSTIPFIGSVVHKQTRVNTVDGWGQLTTPFGTHPALRIVSDITGTDSTTIDTLHFGFKRTSPHVRQYKWIGNGFQEPLLQINTRVIFGFELITSVVYRDSIHPVISAISEPQTSELAFNVFPNPASDNFTIISSSELVNPSLNVTDVCGRTILNKSVIGDIENVDAANWERGIYFVTLRSGNQQSVHRLVIE